MPNRYSDLAFDNGQFIQTYQPLPLEQLQHTADTLAQRHYQNLASLSQLELAREQIKSKLNPGARSYIDEQFQDINAALNDIAANGGENATARVAAISNRFLGDQNVLLAQQRAQEAATQQQMIDKITSETAAPAVYNKQRREALMNAPLTIKNEKGESITNPLYSSPYSSQVEAYLDPTLDYKRIIDEIKPDKWITQGLTPEKVVQFTNTKLKLENGDIDVPKFLSEASKLGIRKEKIDALKDKMFQAYKNTKSYRQQKEFFQQPGESEEQVDKRLKADLHNFAQLGIFEQIDKHYHQISGSGKGGDDTSQQLLNPNVLDPAVVNAKVRPPMPWDIKLGSVEVHTPTGVGLAQNENPSPQEKAVADKNYSKIFNAALEANGGAPGSSGNLPNTEFDAEKFKNSKEGKEMVKNFLDTFYKDELSNAYAVTVDKKTGAAIDDFLHRNPAALNYIDQNGKLIPMLEPGNSEINDDWEDLTGGKTDKFSYGNTLNPYNLRAGLTGEDAAAAGLHQVTSLDEDGKVKVFYVSNPAEIASNPIKVNTTILYNKLVKQPGVYVPLPNGTEAKILVGKQKDEAWETHKENIMSSPEVQAIIANNEAILKRSLSPDEKLYYARQIFNQQKPLIEIKTPDGLQLGTPLTAAGQLASQGFTLSFKDQQ